MNIHLTLLIPLKLVDFPNNFICWCSKGLCSFSFLSFRALSKDCFEHELCWQDGCADPLYVFNWDSTKAPSGGIRHAEKYTNIIHSEWKWNLSNSLSVSCWNQYLLFEGLLKRFFVKCPYNQHKQMCSGSGHIISFQNLFKNERINVKTRKRTESRCKFCFPSICPKEDF